MTSIDKTAPKLVSALPKKGGTAIAVNQDVVLTFNEAIQLGTGNIIISNGAGDTIIISTPPPRSSPEISISGAKFTLNPAKDLLPNSHYTVKIDSTAIQDLSGNKYAGIKNTTTLYFDTVDTLAPRLVKSSPLASAPSVATNSNIVLTLSEKIQAGTGNITLISGNDSRTFAITDKQVKISGTTLTINPSVDFNIASTYKVHLDAGAIKDLASVNNLAAAIDLSFTTKATSDKQAPVLQNYSGKGLVSDHLQLAFQENIKIGKGSFTLVNSADSKDKIVISATDTSQVSVVNNVLSINPKDNLKPETTYLLSAPKGILTDVAKNAFAGIAIKVPFTFDTHDKIAPTLTITDDKTSATNSAILYTFTASEAIKDFSVDDITVTGGAKGEFKAIAGTNNYTLSVMPTANSTAPVTVNVVAGKFTDLVNNANLVTATSTQEIDTVAPTLVITDDQTGVASSPILYTFTLSEASDTFTLDDITVTGGTKAATLTTVSPTVYTLSVTPDASSIKSITVDVAAGKFSDTAGNGNVVAVQNSQAVDTALPTITIIDDKTTTTNGAIFYNFTLSEASTDFSIEDITVVGGTKGEFKAVSATSYTLSVTPDKNSIKPVTVDVATAKFSDAASNGNVVALQNSQEVDTKAPLVVATTPLDNGLNIAKGSNIVLTFDEKVIAGTGNLVVSNGTDTQTISVKDTTQVFISDNLLTINPTNDLLENSHYTVTFASGVISDSLGNAFSGLTSHFKTVAPITPNDVVLTAKAIDGYLKSANVYADANGNGKQDPDEASATTDENGNFKLVNAKGPINISGGTDLSTGKPFAGTLKAPEGSTVVTPLTTVQQGFIEAGQTPAQAEQSVAKAFGFDASKVDLTTYDPIAEVVKAGTTGATSSIAAQMMASSAQIANFMVTAGQVLQGAAGESGNLSTQNAGAALLKSLVSAITSDAKTGDGAINLGDAALLKSVLVDGAKEANAQAQKEAQATGTIAPKFDAANFTDKIDKMADTVTAVLKSAADNIVTAVNNSKGGDALALLSNMDKVSAFAQNDAGASLQKIATTLDTKDTTALNAALKSQSDLFTGDAATKSIETKVVETQKAVGDIIAADKIIADKAAADKIIADKAAADKIIADKAAADKIIADKAAADKIIADKAAADKIIADKAAADKVIADKIIADKAAADKIIADKAAADKIIADKAAADKIIADKAAADNIIADKAAADKIIADKAAADKIIADKAAADKIIADKAATDKIIADKAAADKIIADKAAADLKALQDAQDNTPPTVSVTTEIIKNTANAHVQSNESGTVYIVNTSIAVSSLSSITGAADASWNSVSVSANTLTNLPATGLTDGTYKAYAVDTSGNLSSASSNMLTINAGSNVTISGNGSNATTLGADVYTVLAGNYTYTINATIGSGFNGGDKLNFFPDAVLNVTNDTDQTDGNQTLTATDPATNATVTLNLTGLTSAQDAAIFNVPSLNTTFAASNFVNLNNIGAAGVDTFNIPTGNYNLTIAGFNTGDKLNIFSGAVLNLINDTDQTDGMQVFTATDSTNNTTATITLTGLTGSQDAALFNISSFDTVFTANTLILNNTGSSDTSVYSITAGNSRTIAGFVSGNKLSFFSGAVLNLINDTNQTDGIQELTATDPVSGAVATITLTGLTGTQDVGLFNIPSFNTVFLAGTIAL